MDLNEKQIGFKEARSLDLFLHRQLWHLIALLVLLPITWSFAVPAMEGKTWLGIKDSTCFLLAVGVPIVHQIIVWIVFRLQLGWATLSKIFGDFDLFVWALVFLPFLFGRVIVLLGLARTSSRTLMLPDEVAIPLAIFLMVPALYTLWSVIRYFGLIRALGADHFRIAYRKMPFVKEGIFKLNSNAMYAFAFFILWTIALLFGSQAALSVALFQHAYIWVHYFCTERPDMDIIYKNIK
ncbi:MAG: hypothetical protein CVV00_02260 [Firmicutes bacterium HGW-Firmicutes-5]|nr:MAG: hypothetical protein CVV00_02260 [Firmicutes bacterium HGW-Firmicutes-5]